MKVETRYICEKCLNFSWDKERTLKCESIPLEIVDWIKPERLYVGKQVRVSLKDKVEAEKYGEAVIISSRYSCYVTEDIPWHKLVFTIRFIEYRDIHKFLDHGTMNVLANELILAKEENI